MHRVASNRCVRSGASALLLAVALAACGPSAGPSYRPEEVLACALEPSARWSEPGEGGTVRVVTNALGLRGPDVVVPKPADVLRILVLGDEFSFGSGVEEDERWTAVLQRELRGIDGRRVEMVTAAAPGWCPAQQFLFLRKQGLELQPDLVLWQLATDDLREMALIDASYDTRSLPIGRLPRPTQDGRLAAWLIDDLHAQKRHDFEAQLERFHQGRSTRVIEASLRRQLTARRAGAGEPLAPDVDLEQLSALEIQRGLRAGNAFAVRYLDFLVGSARALCRSHDAHLRLLLVDDSDTPGDTEAGALRGWAARQDPSVFDTHQTLAAGGPSDAFFFKDVILWRASAHARVGAAAALWIASDPEAGLATRATER